MTLQQIFNKFSKEMREEGSCVLLDYLNFADTTYNHDPFQKGAKAVREFFKELGLDYWKFHDQRLHLLIDMQYIAYCPKECWEGLLKKLAQEWRLYENDTNTIV